jgi:predicted metal-binding protein
MAVARKINYDIGNIQDSIVDANEWYQKIKQAEKKRLYREKLKLVNKDPRLKEILSMKHIYENDVKGVKNFARLGIMPPELIVVDERIRDMCLNQFWLSNPITRVKDFGRCPAYDHRPCCPPRSPSSKVTRKLLDRSDIFVMLQSKLIGNREIGDPHWKWQYETVEKLEEELKSLLGKSRVLAKYGAGPCVICGPAGCTMTKDCRYPDKKFCAVESVGMAVGQMCRDMALFTGARRWDIRWIRNWTLPTQTPQQFRLVFGLAIRLPQ